MVGAKLNYRMRIIIYGACLVTLLFLGCKEGYETPEVIEKIPIDLKVKRFDQDFKRLKSDDFTRLKEEYPFLIPRNNLNVDSLWSAQRKDTLQQLVLSEVAKVFPKFLEEEAEINLLFKHVKFYFPEFKEPTVVTLVSNVDYRNRVIASNDLLLIALDTYLGSTHEFYQDYAAYIARDLKKNQIVPDIAETYAKQLVPGKGVRTFIDQMVYFGKIAYLKSLFIPFRGQEQVMNYSKEDLEWAQMNEEQIWNYFVENELLFSTNSDLPKRFLVHAPFSKFYLELDSESPGMLGRYIGWQIVNAFMSKNDVSLRDLLLMKGEDVFNKSKFKPARS